MKLKHSNAARQGEKEARLAQATGAAAASREARATQSRPAIAIAGHHANADATLCGHAQTAGQTGPKKRGVRISMPAGLSVWEDIIIISKA